MAVRSTRFFGPTTVAAGTTVLLYTVPALRTARFSLIVVATSGAGTLVQYLRVNGTGVAQNVYARTASGFDFSEEVLHGLVLNPGDTLHGVAQTGTNLRVSGYGSLLDGAPS